MHPGLVIPVHADYGRFNKVRSRSTNMYSPHRLRQIKKKEIKETIPHVVASVDHSGGGSALMVSVDSKTERRKKNCDGATGNQNTMQFREWRMADGDGVLGSSPVLRGGDGQQTRGTDTDGSGLVAIST